VSKLTFDNEDQCIELLGRRVRIIVEVDAGDYDDHVTKIVTRGAFLTYLPTTRGDDGQMGEKVMLRLRKERAG
jgi:hypothetical protein